MRAGGGRFRGVRYSAGWDASDVIGNSRTATGPHVLRRQDFRAGLARLSALGLSFDAAVSSPTGRCHRPGPGLPRRHHHHVPCGRAARLRPLCREGGRGVHRLEGENHRTGHLPECRHAKLGGMMNRLAAYDFRARPAPVASTELAGHPGALTWRRVSSCSGLTVACSKTNFPVEKMGIGWATLWNAFKRIAAAASATEKHALFSGTARRVYRLD